MADDLVRQPMRVIAGSPRGRRLEGTRRGHPPDDGPGPRGALLVAGDAGPRCASCSTCIAGSGSIGLEALSRGAAEVVFVETRPEGTGGAQGQHRRGRTGRRGRRQATSASYLRDATAKFDLVFVDPPYALPLASVEEILGRVKTRLKPARCGRGAPQVRDSGIPSVPGLVAGGSNAGTATPRSLDSRSRRTVDHRPGTRKFRSADQGPSRCDRPLRQPLRPGGGRRGAQSLEATRCSPPRSASRC